MSIKFERTSYVQALKKNKYFRDDKIIFNCMKESLQFNYGDVSLEKFNGVYSDKGLVGRKVSTLPLALWSGIFKSIYHIFKAIFLGIPKAFSDKGAYLKTQGFCVIRDFQESYGRLTSLFNDRYGQFHIQESQFLKIYYECMLNQTILKLSEIEIDPKYSITEDRALQKKFGSELYEKLNKKFINII